MCANNLVNGVYVCENNYTTNHILREYGGFRGWMCSDYRGTRSTIDAANNGLDIAMPGPPSRPDYFGVPLLAAIKSGRVPEATVTEKVVRIVYSLAVVGALDSVNPNNSSNDATSDAHRALTRSLAAQSAILLRNAPVAVAADATEVAAAAAAPLLPLDLESFSGGGQSIALIGLAAKEAPLYGGGGSGSVHPKAPVSIYEALATKLWVKPAPVVVDCQVTANNTDFFIPGGVHVQPTHATPVSPSSNVLKCPYLWLCPYCGGKLEQRICYAAGGLLPRVRRGRWKVGGIYQQWLELLVSPGWQN